MHNIGLTHLILGQTRLQRLAAWDRGTKFNEAYATANVDVFASAITPTHTPAFFRIEAAHSATGTVSVARAFGGATGVEVLGTITTASGQISAITAVTQGESINIRFGATGTIMKLSVIEMGGI